jgi:hypothetical protein
VGIPSWGPSSGYCGGARGDGAGQARAQRSSEECYDELGFYGRGILPLTNVLLSWLPYYCGAVLSGLGHDEISRI